MVPGSRIGRFEVVETIGEGGMSTVYRVRHAQLDTSHALKILRLGQPSLARRMLQEGRIQARLHHPNVVAVTDVIEHQGSIGLLMELVDGFSLEDCLASEAMDVDEALDIFRQVLDGVAAAHAAGVTHRDLKPGNILLTTRQNRVIAKVTDFGIAKVYSEEATGTRTRAGATMGTPGYMAPEQIRNSASVDHRADIFALGTILYEMLSGRPAFREADTLSSMTRVAQGRCVRLDELAPAVPAHVAEAVHRALLPDPDERFADCGAFAQALYGDGVALPEPGSAVPAPAPASTATGPAPTLAPSDLDEGLLASAFADAGEEEGRTFDDGDLPGHTYAEGTLVRGGERLHLESTEEPIDDDDTDGDVAPPSLLPAGFGQPEQAEEPAEHEPPAAGAMNPEEAADTFKDLALSLLHATAWAMARVLRYGAMPSIAFVVFLWWAGTRASYRIEQLAADERAQAAALQISLDAGVALLPGLVASGADAALLSSTRTRYESTTTIEGKVTVAQELASVMSLQLARLPAATTPPELEQRRRVELALSRIDKDMAAYVAARDRHEEERSSSTGRLAVLFGMVEDR